MAARRREHGNNGVAASRPLPIIPSLHPGSPTGTHKGESPVRPIAFSLAIALTVFVTACGQYTNFPARIHVSGESNLIGEVLYAGDPAKPTVTVKNPKLVLVGESGSIGATFDKMNITYTGVPDSFASKILNLTTGLRVDSSHQFEQIIDNKQPNNKIVPSKLINGKGGMDLPVITADVVKLGNPAGGSFINVPISAVVTLTGTDDALWPVDLQFGVPINFVR
jgi:hypothetical protein